MQNSRSAGRKETGMNDRKISTKPVDTTKLSPMMRQYWSVKEKYVDQLLFFRLGDFYELFFDDALIASRELELTLTGKECGLEERAPMCGIPYHSSENYIAKLVRKGYKVAICEQMEDPATAKGLVKREIIRVVTPGTVLESNMLDAGSNNYLCFLYQSEQGEHFGLAFADVSTGEVTASQIDNDWQKRVLNDLGRFAPAEVLLNKQAGQCRPITDFLNERLHVQGEVLDQSWFEWETCCRAVQEQFSSETTQKLTADQDSPIVYALGAMLQYLVQTQKHGLESLTSLDIYSDNQYMTLDLTARRNLELIQTMRNGERRGTLLWVLDKTQTPMGKRLLLSQIVKPLINPTAINKRLNAVGELRNDTIRLDDIREVLRGIFDLERLITRIVYGSVTPREMRSLEAAARQLPTLKETVGEVRAVYLKHIMLDIDPLEDICGLIDCAIDEDPPAVLKDGGVIRKGYSKELDDLREIVHNTKGVLSSIEAKERERTGIKNLKIGFNNVFGYYIEVTKSFLSQVPQEYIRKQTLTGSERYITQELKELEQTILGARDKILVLENQLFDEVRQQVAAQIHRVQKTANAIAWLDLYADFAKVSIEQNYCRPEVDLSGKIHIQDGRHPVVEKMLTDTLFVANDLLLDKEENQVAIITGPNMAGKSTYMRQAALIVLMAQLGCYVPARSAQIGVVDGIYTRVGASDDLSAGQSTFMVEMNEVAQILKSATANSLLILDEIGRGTSTFDGMSIARAVIEHIANRKKLGAKTLFATHYHELTELEQSFPNIKNYNIAVKKQGADIYFLRRIVRGGTDDSYGIEVSRLAGIPEEIIQRAQQILKQLESSGIPSVTTKTKRKQTQEPEPMVLVQQDDSELVRRLKEIDVEKITPVQALVLLSELKARI